MDLDKIKAGLQEALEKERKAGAPEKQPRRLNVKRSPRKNSTFGFNMTENPADDLVMEEFIGPTPLIDDVRYIGLEDMGALLGFDEEHQDVEEGPRTWSWLRMKRN